MEGAIESTELRRHPRCSPFFISKIIVPKITVATNESSNYFQGKCAKVKLMGLSYLIYNSCRKMCFKITNKRKPQVKQCTSTCFYMISPPHPHNSSKVSTKPLAQLIPVQRHHFSSGSYCSHIFEQLLEKIGLLLLQHLVTLLSTWLVAGLADLI